MTKQKTFKISLNNFTQEMRQFIENQDNVQRSIARLIEDAVGRYGTGDLLQSTKIRLHSKDEVNIPNCSVDTTMLLSALLGRNTPSLSASTPEEEQITPPKGKCRTTKDTSVLKGKEVKDMVFDATIGIDNSFVNDKPESNDTSDELTNVQQEDEPDIILELEDKTPEDNADKFDHALWDD